MGMERYEEFVRRARGSLVYDPGWSCDNLTGAWRTERPVMDVERCNQCNMCWLYCPEGCISHGEILRAGVDQRLEIDTADLRFVFQGVLDSERNGLAYGEIPWRLGLLTSTK